MLYGAKACGFYGSAPASGLSPGSTSFKTSSCSQFVSLVCDVYFAVSLASIWSRFSDAPSEMIEGASYGPLASFLASSSESDWASAAYLTDSIIDSLSAWYSEDCFRSDVLFSLPWESSKTPSDFLY